MAIRHELAAPKPVVLYKAQTFTKRVTASVQTKTGDRVKLKRRENNLVAHSIHEFLVHGAHTRQVTSGAASSTNVAMESFGGR